MALGSKRLSVDDLMDCRVLSTESEKLELERCLREFDISAMVEARPDSRLRTGKSLCRAVLFAMNVGVSMEGVIVRSRSMVYSMMRVTGGMVTLMTGSGHGLAAE